MKTKKILLVVVFMAFFAFGATNVNASEYVENLIKKIAPDGVNGTVKMVKPVTENDVELALSAVLTKMLGDENYIASATCEKPDYTVCKILIWESEPSSDGFSEEYDIKLTYDEPSIDSINMMNEYVSKMKVFGTNNNEYNYYFVDDLNLINYYLTSVKSELWNNGAPARALKYSKDIINLTNGGNISFSLDVRAGIQDETLMYENGFGAMTLFYNGYAYAQKIQGLYLKRILYIPEETGDTKEEYVAAAQKRINDYLGKNNDVIVSYGGLLSSLPSDTTDETVVPSATTDGNYYNIKVKDKTYKFYIMKGKGEQLLFPKYVSTELNSNVGVLSEDSSIPLDTALSVENVENDAIRKALGTDNYYAYDIKLFSDSGDKYITKLENGKFEVSIPVPEKYNGKSLRVLYINANGEKEEHAVNIKNGYAVFETDHFSTYILTETTKTSNNEENPDTYDGIPNYILLASISLIGLVGGILYLKRNVR